MFDLPARVMMTARGGLGRRIASANVIAPSSPDTVKLLQKRDDVPDIVTVNEPVPTLEFTSKNTLSADVVTLALAYDIDILAEKI